MEFIDSHTHLYLNDFDKDRNVVVEKALQENVRYMLLPNIDTSSISAMLSLCDNFPGVCFPMMGLHPSSVKSDFETDLLIIEKWLNKKKFIAIGETGIDLYWDKKYGEQQKEVFGIHVKWAREKQLPLVIHARNSYSELFSILDRHADEMLKGVFHSFTGNLNEAERILEYGFYIGINGIVTFKNSGLEKVLRYVLPEKLLIETDSPYLAPSPFRGKRNESANLKYIAARLADIYDLSVEKIAYITSENAKVLFGI